MNAPHAVARIDHSALAANMELLSGMFAPAQTLLAVKADAYGHGMLACARTGLAHGATSLGVLEVSSGLALRDAGVSAPMLAWLHGTGTPFREGVESDIELGVSALWQLEAIAAAGASKPARVHLKIDTGLHRGGANPDEWPALVSRALELERAGRLVVHGAWTHLADTSEEEDAASVRRFDEAVAEAKALGADIRVEHIAASSAGIYLPDARRDLVRLGLAAYGISPFHDRSGAELGLRPVMRVEAPVVAVDVAAGTAVLGLGFGDGFPCGAAGAGSVLIGDERHEVRSVDVDRTVVDVSGGSGAGGAVHEGDVAVVFGAGDDGEPTAEDWSHWVHTVPDEIVTGLTARVPRVHESR